MWYDNYVRLSEKQSVLYKETGEYEIISGKHEYYAEGGKQNCVINDYFPERFDRRSRENVAGKRYDKAEEENKNKGFERYSPKLIAVGRCEKQKEK